MDRARSPYILMIGGFVFEAVTHESLDIKSSINSYYYTRIGNVFVGLLCAIGVFHLATKGYDLIDRVAGRLVRSLLWALPGFPPLPNPPVQVNPRTHRGSS